MNKKLIINIVLVLVACFLAYLVIDSVYQPIKFNNILNQRQEGTWDATNKQINNAKGEYEKCVKQSLMDIRDAQELYKQTHNAYTSSFDTLIAFVKNDSLPIIHRVHDESDTTYTKTIDRITHYVKLYDTLYGHRVGFNIDNLGNIPYSENEAAKFEMEAGFITKNNIKVAVFEARAPYETYLWDQDKQRVINLRSEREDMNKYPGLKVGSMTDITTSGNWE